MAFSIGETLQDGRYQLHTLLDQHPWGMTFLATHACVEPQQVVIKTFQAAPDGPTPLQIASFIDYAKKLRRFHHPHLARVFSIFEERNQACMVSEFIQGTPFNQLIQDQPLTENTALIYIRQIAQGLQALHRHGLLHLNLSPNRILKRQSNGQSILLGLNSRFASQDSERNRNPYLSFEQHQTPVIPGMASEIYGISAVLYKLVTGQAPIPACDRTKATLIFPKHIRPELSQSIEEAIIAGMALAPSDRPQRIKDWLKILPQPQKVDATTKLQIPSAWQVKLPAFHEAGIKEDISTTLTPNPAPDVKTTLQTTSAQDPADPLSRTNGHDQLDSTSTEPSLQPKPVLQSRTVDEPPVKPAESVSSGPLSDVPPSESPLEREVPSSSARSSNTIRMPATFSAKNTHRFPKWALFWCALVAACGGLGAGLWFRINLTQQFAGPPEATENSPIDQLKTLKTKQEEFLPRQNSVVPEDNIDDSGIYEFESSEPDENIESFENTPNVEAQGDLSDEPWLDPEPWRTDSEGTALEQIEEQPYLDGNRPYEDPYNEAELYEETAPILTDEPYSEEFDRSSQAIDEPIDLEDSDSFVSDPVIDSATEERYRSDGSSYDPNSGTF